MDPARKRKFRFVIALSCALLLASALIYTSFSASSEARSPSQLAAAAKPGQVYELTGKVEPGSISSQGTTHTFRVRDREGHVSVPVSYTGALPDPFRDGREIIVDVRKQGATFVGERDTPGHEVPVEVHGREKDLIACSSLGSGCLWLALGVALYGIGASLYGARRGGRAWVDSGRRAVYATAGVRARRLRGARGRVPALGLRAQRRRRPLLDHHAHLLPRHRGVVLAGGLAAAVGACCSGCGRA